MVTSQTLIEFLLSIDTTIGKFVKNLAYWTIPIWPLSLPKYGLVSDDEGSHTDISGENIQQIMNDIVWLLYTSNPLIDLHDRKSSYLHGFNYTNSWLRESDHIFNEPFLLAVTIDSGFSNYFTAINYWEWGLNTTKVCLG